MSGRRSFLPFPTEVPGSSGEGGGGTSLAAGNYAAIDDGAPANSAAAPATYVIAAIILTPQVSGIFRVTANLTLTDSASEEVSLILRAAEQAVPATPIALVGGTAAAQLGSTAAAGSIGEVSTVAATPITETGTGSAKTLATKTVGAVATDATTIPISGLFSFSTGGTTKTPFTLDTECVLFLAVTAAAGTLSAMNLEFSAQEQGAP